MRRKLTAVAVLGAAAIGLSAFAAAGPVAANDLTTRQRVAIQKNANGSFVLTPLTSGSIKRDTGSTAFCCFTETRITRDGQTIDINNPQMTLTSKRGTLVVRNRIGFIDIPDGWAVFTGTWKVVRGTGDYAGIEGGGRGAGIMLTDGTSKSTFEGVLSST